MDLTFVCNDVEVGSCCDGLEVQLSGIVDSTNCTDLAELDAVKIAVLQNMDINYILCNINHIDLVQALGSYINLADHAEDSELVSEVSHNHLDALMDKCTQTIVNDYSITLLEHMDVDTIVEYFDHDVLLAAMGHNQSQNMSIATLANPLKSIRLVD